VLQRVLAHVAREELVADLAEKSTDCRIARTKERSAFNFPGLSAVLVEETKDLDSGGSALRR
jgi:hypothetical protein